jgi:hypothetical protein
MNPSRKIAAALDESTRAYVLPCAVTVEDAPNRFTLNLTALDSVGVAFDNLDFVTTDRQDWSSDALNAWGERLAGRVTYLLEPLKVLEIDARGGEVQIRSKSPSVRADQRGFYEVRLYKQGMLRMERYVVDDATRQRRRTPCQFTREVLERLADDIAASAS